MSKPSWYALQVMTGCEAEVGEKLRRMGMEALTPMRLLPERHLGVWTIKTRIVFPGYAFAALDMTPERYYAVKALPNVIKFLGAEKPESIPPEQLAIVKLLGYGDKLLNWDGGKIGLCERLTDAGAEIISVDMRQRRAKIGVTLMSIRHEIQLGILMQPD